MEIGSVGRLARNWTPGGRAGIALLLFTQVTPAYLERTAPE
jgi:hypothetical protein